MTISVVLFGHFILYKYFYGFIIYVDDNSEI